MPARRPQPHRGGVAPILRRQRIPAYLFLAPERGTGYLLKERVTDEAELIDALDRLVAGGTVVDPGLVNELVTEQPQRDRLAHLTGREQAVLELVAAGLKDRAIADRLLMGTKTVETHVAAIFRKLNLTSNPHDNRRVHAVLLYLRQRSPGPVA